jgi:hypothetical protein
MTLSVVEPFETLTSFAPQEPPVEAYPLKES